MLLCKTCKHVILLAQRIKKLSLFFVIFGFKAQPAGETYATMSTHPQINTKEKNHEPL